MSVSELDDLLNDLERTMNHQQSHGDGRTPTSAAIGAKGGARVMENKLTSQKTPVGHQPFSSRYSHSSHLPSRCSDSRRLSPDVQQNMITMSNHNPVKQNINELDNLLQDLSNARFSEQTHVEKRSEMMSSTQTFTESSTLSQSMSSKEMMSSNGFPGSVMRSMASESEKHTEESSRSTVMQGDSVHRSSVERSSPEKQFSTSSTEQRNISNVTSRNGFQASSATRELDDLMTSLNTFKIKEGPAEEPVPTSLDDMLGNLQQDMDKQGIRTTQKGICAECQKPIIGQVITALGKTFHPEHFVCAKCNQELGTKNFFERDGKPFCELDYHSMFSPRCASCEGPILDKCVSALDKTWHPEHFVCAGENCGRQFGDDGYHERDGQAFCRDCYYSAFAPRCGACSLPIAENYISSLDRPWHPACFVCAQCQQPFRDGNFYEHDGKPYCEIHYHEMRGSPCAGCGKPISGRCITAMFRKFHPEHFVCSFCLKQLNKGTFKEKEDKPYCHGCYDRLFG